MDEINAELTAHMMKEEIVLFPYIKELVSAKKNEQVLHASHFGTVQNPINMMEMEHEIVGKNIHLENNILFPKAVELEQN